VVSGREGTRKGASANPIGATVGKTQGNAVSRRESNGREDASDRGHTVGKPKDATRHVHAVGELPCRIHEFDVDLAPEIVRLQAVELHGVARLLVDEQPLDARANRGA
jgi:hypothetical protein